MICAKFIFKCEYVNLFICTPTILSANIIIHRTATQKCCFIFHNESTFHFHEDQGWIQAEKEKKLIRPKAIGQGIMVSDIIDEFNGY